MQLSDQSHDDCPNCRQRFEILLVKFALGGVRMITACPNCAMVHGDHRDGKRRSEKRWKRVRFQIPLGARELKNTQAVPDLADEMTPARSSRPR
jgi:hypothetical protein